MPNEMWKAYQTDVLILLVGTNPLPNYVAACLLAKPKATIYLLHSQQDGRNTYEVARRLQTALKKSDCRPDLDIRLRGISRSDPADTYRKIKMLLSEVPSVADVGLNYTGGTKAMAVHVYHALREKYPSGIYSYLDAASLMMIVTKEGMPTQRTPVGQDIELDFETLFALHGYKIEQIRCEPEHTTLSHAIAQVCATPQGFHEWKGRWDKQKQSKGWLQSGRPLKELPTRHDYPHLDPIIRVFERWGGTPEHVAQRLGCNTLDSCYIWFSGTWLEEYTFKCLKSTAEHLNIKALGIDLKPVPAPREGEKKVEESSIGRGGHNRVPALCHILHCQ